MAWYCQLTQSTSVGESELLLQSSTGAGDSGAPVLDATTGVVIGVHLEGLNYVDVGETAEVDTASQHSPPSPGPDGGEAEPQWVSLAR